MPSFAELKQKAVKAKDASVTKIQNTKDRHTSVPLKKTNWDPYSGQGPPPPPPPRTNSWTKPPKPAPPLLPPPTRSSSNVSASGSGSGTPSPSPSPGPPGPPGPPVINRSTRPGAAPSPSASPALPGRPTPSKPPSLRARIPSYQQPEPEVPAEIDWANLSPQDKEVFFSWLDEFFERSYGISPGGHR